MTPDRTKDKRRGCYRIDRVFKGVGRVRVTSGTTKEREYHRRNDVLTKLYEDGRLDILAALRDRKVSVVEVVAAHRHGSAATLASVGLVRPLWETLDATVPLMGDHENQHRARQAIDKLRATGILKRDARVRDLTRVDWRGEVRPHFGGASDWMKLRAALSRYLTLTLGDVRHPVRVQVATAMGAETVRERVPNVDVATFWRIHRRLPAWARDPVLTIAGLGLRSSEYVDATEEGKRGRALELVVDGKSGPRTVAVPEVLWPVVDAAVPARYARPRRPGERVSSCPRYQRLAKALRQAADAEGSDLTLHGLRHLTAQLASDAGHSDAAVGDVLGHASGSAGITRRYTKRTQRRQAADDAAAALLKGA